ncbi:Maturation and nuclear export of 40S ribosomal subunits interacting protein [Coemansia javaensis]|uniref:Maturation and nuclear export of 40S ribosomal subunits interacting protein n=1 Tax=Coemansia javaensis TaxID=2761396 RepID=A0A9W8LMY2_9FUNG|nr:Maturation and nuclear export of 40S ribosomal subunits interacting protein [Coemansia javaensis]
MASGIGYRGTNRCFPFWEDFQQCHFSSTDKTRADCVPARDDYIECLHHFKEIARVRAIQAVERGNYARAKASGTDHAIDEERALIESVRKWEAGVASSHQNINDIAEILRVAKGEHVEAAFAAIGSLGRIYAGLWTKGLLRRGRAQDAAGSAAAAKVAGWLRDHYNQYMELLRTLLGHREAPMQVAALRALMQMVGKEGEAASEYAFPNEGYLGAIETVLGSSATSEHLLRTLAEAYVGSYDDLWLYFYRNVARIMSPDYDPFKGSARRGGGAAGRQRAEVSETLVRNAFAVLSQVRAAPKTEREAITAFWAGTPAGDSDAAVLSPAAHRKAFSEAWLAFMRQPLMPDMYKQILLTMHRRIIPHMVDPKALMDFLSSAYDAGGSTSLLALNGLFTLITEHNLNYPQFYPKLYALLDRNLLHVKYRARFFRLLEIFLRSTHLPAYLIAAFAKRLSRLALAAPPAGAVTVIPMVYNLLKAHPSCMVLIHRVPEHDAETGEERPAADSDPFDADEPDPAKSRAIDSSLWELATLQHHYYPNIATLANVFSEPFHKPGFALEDFMDHTYASFFESDTARRPKKAPALAAQPPTSLIRPGDALSDFIVF